MPNHSIYLSQTRSDFIKKNTKGISDYVNKKIDEDTKLSKTPSFCRQKIEELQKELQYWKKLEKRGKEK